MTDRSTFTAFDTIKRIWRSLDLPPESLKAVRLTGTGHGLPSSFKIGHLAQASIALSALSAALLHAACKGESVRTVTVTLQHACVEFKSERFYSLDGKPPLLEGSAVGGLHATSDGHVRIHDGFLHHRNAALKILGLPEDAAKNEIKTKLAERKAKDLEAEAFKRNAIIVELRSPEEWDATPQAKAVEDLPISITKIGDAPKGLKKEFDADAKKCLSGLRVLEMTRVIAAPVAGRTLAAHGADVLWVTSPNLPDLPVLDIDTGRGKRTAQLDVNDEKDKQTFEALLRGADVFVQSYRSGSLAARGFSAEAIAAKSKEGIVFGTLSAYGSDGPWSAHRGFDSIVQTCSGINVAEARAYGTGEASRVLPCQALDHASGYFLATGVMAALYRQAIEGGSYQVEVSLAATMKYLRSLGQYEGRTGFECEEFDTQKDVPEEFLEERQSEFGMLKAVKHAAIIEGLDVGWESMPRKLGSDGASWL